MRASLRSIAAAAGVSVATVSIALRGLAKVDPATRERVLKIADELGYVRDPQLSGALAFARKREKTVFRETLAFLADLPAQEYANATWLGELHDGVRELAAARGYGLECLRYPNTAGEQRALGRRMVARGIRGLIVTPGLKRGLFTLDIDWDAFAAVEIGQTLIRPALPQIGHDSPDDYAAMFDELLARGYRRIGMAITRHDEIRRHWAMMSAYLVFQYKNPRLPRLKPLEGDAAYWTAPQLETWFKKERPEVVVTNGPGVARWLGSSGRSVLEKVGVCRIDATAGAESGLRPDYRAMGRAAVESLSSLLERGRLGRAVPVSSLCIPNGWREGASLRPRPADAPPSRLPAA